MPRESRPRRPWPRADLKQLGAALKQSVSEDGPVAAIKVCRDIAPTIANELSLENGWKVTRVGTRVRNSMMGMPDAWEQSALETFGERAQAGEKLPAMRLSDVVTEGDRRYFRFMKPIDVKPLCLGCHGKTEDIPEEVQAVLRTQYPHDMATGYRVGDLRGAVSIKQPLE